jgi:sugar/nucleoside kinase (ribokinase family)
VVIGEALLFRDRDGARLGGGALAATILASLGAEVEMVTTIEDDSEALIFRAMLESTGVTVHCAYGDGDHLSSESADVIGAGDVLLVSDQGTGFLSDTEIVTLLDRAHQPIVWDPHPLNGSPTCGSAIVILNEADAAFFANDHEAVSIVEIAEKLRCSWDVGAVAVTLGKCGAVLVSDSRTLFVPTERVDGEPMGAGDAFVAAVTHSILRKESVSIAVTNAVAFAREWVNRSLRLTQDESRLQ